MGKLKYQKLSDALQERILHDRETGDAPRPACREDAVIRRNMGKDKASLWRPAFVRDIEKIMHCPYYNRYTDKTQVFSFYKNDDITRRALHVQLVSRIARNIGGILGLNLDLIEAIALGHDIGHTPFGHAGERFLNELYQERTGRYFNHNVHSVRVLDTIFHRNLSLQTLDGILCHNGEFEQKEYRPHPLDSFAAFDEKVEGCYLRKAAVQELIPSTLEGCVVRICDMIAYLGKDRQDAEKAKLLDGTAVFSGGELGINNAEIINNLTVNIIENSYGQPFIRMDEAYYHQLTVAKQENNRYIYRNPQIDARYQQDIRPMMEEIYGKLLEDVKQGDRNSVIYRHHIDYVEQQRKYYQAEEPYCREEPNQIVVDYIASMTDDYFIDLYHYLFPKGRHQVAYISYFQNET